MVGKKNIKIDKLNGDLCILRSSHARILENITLNPLHAFLNLFHRLFFEGNRDRPFGQRNHAGTQGHHAQGQQVINKSYKW